mmetsp:Transcript_28599/g.72016  ORF Transcript_28599/g.72016 Transcript_28599/m.72016 type:complete len:353 (+) Transcript_28599:339-1397(+)|eukprot:CAMPEP_0173448346 /NCGR_PEP_ID=MMETSP1357-20121228/40561_1 /TAXON_ID=77926 /ORGANISM="Hemiselmis rufescens, Strain PCC563" /LENGTH=352 /DNA_ID=CAMNT_0014414849 /DNA_START=247 /DNA_END=1305 /DNA_ORIENTATION=+
MAGHVSTAPATTQSMGGYSPSKGNKAAPEGDPFAATLRLLNSSKYQRADGGLFDGLVQKLRMIEEAGMPPMKVVRASVIAELGRIPRSTEGYAVSARTEVERLGPDLINFPMGPIFFFSHRWERPDWCEAVGKDLEYGSAERKAAMAAGHPVGDPDLDDRAKAKALVEWCKYLKSKRNQHPTVSEDFQEVLFFIDWPCVDQENPMPEIVALPAYVSACTGIVAYITPEYQERAWCRVELLMAYAFGPDGTSVEKLERGFTHRPEATGIKVKAETLLDPMVGKLTNEGERDIIRKLKKCAMGSTAYTCMAVWRKDMAWNYEWHCGWCGYDAWRFSRSVKPGVSSIFFVEPEEE